jgi:glyoxylase-like metal-dependent hydrolase (beta-lactamase superfamily II)
LTGVTLAYPTELLGSAGTPKTINLGEITVLIEHQVGHTPTDPMVRVPQRDIVFTCDLLFEKSRHPLDIPRKFSAWFPDAPLSLPRVRIVCARPA